MPLQSTCQTVKSKCKRVLVRVLLNTADKAQATSDKLRNAAYRVASNAAKKV